MISLAVMEVLGERLDLEVFSNLNDPLESSQHYVCGCSMLLKEPPGKLEKLSALY